MRITINRHFSKRGTVSVFCQRHIPMTSYHATNDRIQYGINLFYLSTSQIPTENQSRSQQSAWTSNHSWVQCLYHVPQCQHTRVYHGHCLYNEHINKRSVAWQTWNLHQSSNTARFSVVTFRDMFSIYRTYRVISVHENYKHVQGWNPTTIK